MSASEGHKIIAKKALNTFGGKPKVNKYWDNNELSDIDILSVVDTPFEGVTSYSTIGLSDFNIGYSLDDKPLRVEITGAFSSEEQHIANVIATCAFFVINSNYTCKPGAIFQDVIPMYYPASSMKHILFITPFLWKNKLTNINFANKVVNWVQAVPISENEFNFAKKEGSESLEEIFEKKQINVFDLNRNSVL